MVPIKLKERVKIDLKESHLTSVNFDPSNTVVCIINFNCMSLSCATENLEKLNWLQISMLIIYHSGKNLIILQKMFYSTLSFGGF